MASYAYNVFERTFNLRAFNLLPMFKTIVKLS